MKTIVKDLKTLEALKDAEHITFHEDTGKKLGLHFGGKGIMYYINKAVNHNTFEYKELVYHVEYMDGCFNPYVFCSGRRTRRWCVKCSDGIAEIVISYMTDAEADDRNYIFPNRHDAEKYAKVYQNWN